jgi:glycosyltransferase involved in cell wall biosynthesis
MRIAYIVPSLSNKGPIIVVKQLVEQFVKNKHFCVVYFFDEIYELDFNCETIKIDSYNVISFTHFDVVHSHGLRPDRYVFKHMPIDSVSTIFVSTLHNYVFQDLKYQYNRITSLIIGNLWIYWLRKHDKVITLSIDAANYYSQWIDAKKIDYIYNTCCPDVSKLLSNEEITELVNFKSDSILIGVSALLTHRKGVDILLNALPYLENHKLFVIGDGKSRKKLEKLAVKLNVFNRCYFVGYKKNAYRYMKYFNIFALPSRSEGFPISLLEASYFSIPVVASNLPVIKEAFSEEEVSFFDLANPASIIDAIKMVTVKKDLGVNMNKKFNCCYSPDKMYTKMVSIYKGKLNEKLA